MEGAQDFRSGFDWSEAHDGVRAFVEMFQREIRRTVPQFPPPLSARGGKVNFISNPLGVGDRLELDISPQNKTISVHMIGTDPYRKANPNDRTGSEVVNALEQTARIFQFKRFYAIRVLYESRGFWEKCGFHEIPNSTGVNPNYIKDLL